MKKKYNSTIIFGSHIRKLRIEKNIGQRELAKKIGIAPSYLNDIEKNKRSAPKPKIIKELSLILNIDLDFLNDLAGSSKKTLPPDIIEYMRQNSEIISLVRSIKNMIYSFLTLNFKHTSHHYSELEGLFCSYLNLKAFYRISKNKLF